MFRTMTIAVLVVSLGTVGIARAQSSMPPLPAPQSGNQLELPRIAPQAAPPPNSPRNPNESTLEIPLPQTFRGCWRGVVSTVDSMRVLRESGRIDWMPKTYRICYERTAGGPFRPTFSEAGLLHGDSEISNVRSELKVLSSDGRASASLRGLLHFNETQLFLGVPVGTAQVEELTDMQCTIEGGVMHVEASLYGQWDGQPWVLVSWHADFANSPD